MTNYITDIIKMFGYGAYPMMGGIRASNLTDKQREILIKHYGLDEDSDLVLDNAVNSTIGGVLGMLPGYILSEIGRVKDKNVLNNIGNILSTIGGISGNILKGSKYTSANANSIIKNMEKE